MGERRERRREPLRPAARAEVTRFPFPAATPGGTISAEVNGLYQDKDGSIWVSVLGGGLGRIDPSDECG